MILESLLLGNLIVLSGSTKLVPNRSTALLVSFSLNFVPLCGVSLRRTYNKEAI